MTGDEVRATWFLRGSSANTGYDAAQVDDLLRRVAAELDAGRPIEPLLENAAFRKRRRKRNTHDRDAVDWFLDQLLLRACNGELAGPSADPWRDLPVAQLTRNEGGGPDRGDRKYRAQREYFAEECQNAWRDFGQQPGTYLVRTSYELRTNEQQTIVSVVPFKRARVGERSFTNTRKAGGRTGRSLPPAIAEIGGRSEWARLHPHYKRGFFDTWLDEAGMPVFYTGGYHFDHSAGAAIIFPDQRWLRFPVRGTQWVNAIMTAVDQAGNRVARYRNLPEGPGPIEIAVHPDRNLTDELLLAITISAHWLVGYFAVHSG